MYNTTRRHHLQRRRNASCGIALWRVIFNTDASITLNLHLVGWLVGGNLFLTIIRPPTNTFWQLSIRHRISTYFVRIERSFLKDVLCAWCFIAEVLNTTVKDFVINFYYIYIRTPKPNTRGQNPKQIWIPVHEEVNRQ